MGKHFGRDTVVYQIYPRSFMDTDGDGIGDLRGIISKLDYIASLGVNTIWLSPIYESPDDDNGYDIADYKAISKKFGTMDDFDELVREARERGIDIVMDLVINHTSDEHEWFQRALRGEEKYKNYYIIREGREGGVPNNWGNFFAECPWTPFGEGTNEYYLHLFSKKQPDLNWHNPDVLREIQDIMRFWLDRGVKGFRCDVINVIFKNSLEDGKKRFILTGQEHYLSTNGCHNILKTLRETVLDAYDAWAVGETVFVDLKEAHDLCDEERAELDMVFSFEHMEVDQVIVKWFKTRLRPKKLMGLLNKWQTGLSWNAVYFENHDQPRFISRFSDSGAHREKCSMMVAGLLMCLRGTPFLYEGQEIGMTNGDFASLSDIQDIESHNVYQMAKGLGIPSGMRWRMIARTSRDNARTPMQWTASENAGFTTGTPWLRVNENHTEINVERESERADGVLAFWRYMIGLRRGMDVLMDGTFVPVLQSRKVYAFERVLGDVCVRAIFNMSGTTVKAPKGLLPEGELLACNYDTLGDRLRPFEFRLIQKGERYE